MTVLPQTNQFQEKDVRGVHLNKFRVGLSKYFSSPVHLSCLKVEYESSKKMKKLSMYDLPAR